MRIRVEGQNPLNGVYRPSGNANAAMALLAAALLTDYPIILHEMPKSTSTLAMIRVAEALGAELTWTARALNVRTVQINRRALGTPEVDGFVGVILFFAAILSRRQHARMDLDFPVSRIRVHLEAMHSLGINISIDNGTIECAAEPWKSGDVMLLQPSVTATSLIVMLAASMGEQTIIRNAACEPHVQQLCHMLVQMGAVIDGIGSNLLRVHGSRSLKGTEIHIETDHIEAASVAALSALSGGRVQIEHIHVADLVMIQKVYQRLGIELDIDKESVFVPRHNGLITSMREEDSDASVETAPWPGFPSDLIAMATVIATQSRGTSLIHEKLYSNRLLFVDKLKAMGAQIVLCDPHRAIVVGGTPLQSIYMDSPDVRTGFGMLSAALIANGSTVIDNAQVLERTFEGAIGKLQALGARIILE